LKPSFDEISSTPSIILRPNFLTTLNVHFKGMEPKGPVLTAYKFLDTIVFGGAICWAKEMSRKCYQYAVNIQDEQKLADLAVGLKTLTAPKEITDVKFLYHFDRVYQSRFTKNTWKVTTMCQNRPENTYGEDTVAKEKLDEESN